MTRRRTKPSNRLSHGLRSRARREDRLEEAEDLARHLAAPAASCRHVQEAALSLAEAILYLRDVRRALLSLIASKPGDEPEDAGASAVDAPRLVACVRRLTRNATELGRLREYERKATSRMLRAVNRLDYLTLEARRRAS